MRRTIRHLAAVAAVVFLIIVVVLTGALYTLHTKWFRDKVREKVVAAIEGVSGGRVEIDSFNYDWLSLTAEFRGLVVHGTEPSSAQPLVKASRVRIQLKIISVFERNIDLSSVVVDRPEFHLLVFPDGTTNIPVPHSRRVSLRKGVEGLLSLKVRHFELNEGVIQADVRRFPLNLRGENTSIDLAYRRAARSYDIGFSSHEFRVTGESLEAFSGTLEARAQLGKDNLALQKAIFRSHESTVHASGVLQHFVHPLVDLAISAEVNGSDLAAITKANDVAHGSFTVTGRAHYDENTPWIFQGRLAGKEVAYRIGAVDLRKVSFESDVTGRRDEIELNRMIVTAFGSRLSGQLAFRHAHDLQFDGELRGLSLRDAAAIASKRDCPWSGIITGPVHLRAAFDRGWRDVTLRSQLAIAPASGGIPLSGELDTTYRANGRAVEFADSWLSSPATRLSFAGILGANLDVIFDSTNPDDLNTAFGFLQVGKRPLPVPMLLPKGTAHFDGKVTGPLQHAQLAGSLTLRQFKVEGEVWDNLRSHVVADENGVQFSLLVLDQGALHATADGQVGLQGWSLTNTSPLQLRAEFKGADIIKLADRSFGTKIRSVRGIASGTLNVRGSMLAPSGTAQLSVNNLDAYGERLNQLELGLTFAGDTIHINRGRMQAGPAELSFAGAYQHVATSWREGRVQFKIDSNGFPLASLAPIREYQPGLNAQFEVHSQGAARITSNGIEPLSLDGTAALRDVTLNQVPYGSITFGAGTRAGNLTTTFSGNLRGSRITGSAQVQMAAGNPVVGEARLDEIRLSTIASLIRPQVSKMPLEGRLRGGITFEGPLLQPSKMHGTVGVEDLQLTSNVSARPGADLTAPDITFRNVRPVVFQYADGVATVSSFELTGKGSTVAVSGSLPFVAYRPINVSVNGSVDLQLFQLFDPNVHASGESALSASVKGTLANPEIEGTVDLKNGTLFANNLPNGLTGVNGRVRFDKGRATIDHLKAQTGGGELSLAGFMSFGKEEPIIYRLEAKAENVRVRYAGGVSVTATSQMRLSGTSENSILSGTATVSHVIFNPNTDVGNLLASAAAPTPSPSDEKDFLTGLQFDIHIESAPNLQLNTELSRDVEAEIDLRLRGTPERPVLLGSITANQGDIRVFGTKYSINRGEVDFVNPLKIEPVLDLDLQTQARGITVDITVAGTPGKLNINYRSDPPLQPRDIVALLTIGRAPSLASNVPNISVTNDVTALQSSANTVLGQAISPASNRLSKLFGITNIKIDPMVQGITNTPQARLTVEQQISKQITVTYVTNLSQTSEQIFRLEWAFSSQYSLVALRDDNGEFGIDIQYRKRFK